MLAVFSNRSAIGFGICDSKLRIRAVNRALAESNGIPEADYVGKTVRDILGNLAAAIEPALQRVWATGGIVSKEFSGTLPSRGRVIHRLAAYFPLKGRNNKVQRVGGIVVDVTDLRELERSVSQLNRSLPPRDYSKCTAAARELRDSTSGYFAALTRSLRDLPRQISQLDRSGDEQLSTMVESLDHRIVTMRTLISVTQWLSRRRCPHN